MFLSLKDKQKIQSEYNITIRSFENLIFDINKCCNQLRHKRAIEYCKNGLMRRAFLNIHCLRRIYEISPPLREEHLTQDERQDLTVFLQIFLFNISGIIDNLAWIWFYEQKIYEKENEKEIKVNVALFNRYFRKYLTNDMKNLFDKFKEWQNHIKNFRDPFAHRIPLYIVPYFVNKEGASEYYKLQNNFFNEFDIGKRNEILKKIDTLGVYEPVYTHSYIEKSPLVPLHPQVLANTNTTIEIVKIVIKNL